MREKQPLKSHRPEEHQHLKKGVGWRDVVEDCSGMEASQKKEFQEKARICKYY